MIESSFGPLPGAKEVNEYILHYRRSEFKPLTTQGPIDLFPEKQVPIGIKPAHTFENWQSADLTSSHPGVYLVYSESFAVLYIGKASMKALIGRRLWTYFGNGDKCIIKDPKKWEHTPRFLVNIAVPDDMPFEAPLLEEYLIGQIDPSGNVLGKKRKK
jgi:hypothetical protein